MDRIEPAGSRTTNGILFFKSRVSLQIVQFKNAASHGEHIIDLPEGLQKKLLAYMRTIRPVYALDLSRRPRSGDDEEAADEEEESDSDDPDAGELMHVPPSASHLPTRAELCDEVKAWRAQAPWLFLMAGNQRAKKIGKLWIDFVQENTGQKTSLRVWRKVVETSSSTQNSLEKQQTLSAALLHQHKTGRDYYVTHDPRAKSAEVHNVWTGLMGTSSNQVCLLLMVCECV
jgi:hypothetical protein